MVDMTASPEPAFDTRKAVNKLREKGFSDEQSDGVVEIVSEARADSVTKSDLEPLATRLDVERAVNKILMAGIVGIGILVAILKFL